MVLIGEVEDATESRDAGGFKLAFLGVEEGSNGVNDCFLTEIEHFIDVMMFFRGGANAAVDLLELRHQGKEFFLEDLLRFGNGVGWGRGEIGFVGAEHDGDIDAERAEVWHPEEGDSFVGVVVGVDEEDDVRFAEFGAEGRA